MESDYRQSLLAVLSAGSAEAIARTVCGACAGATCVLARVWLLEDDGDLHLVASAGCPTGGGSYHRVDGEFRRIAIGAGKIGRIAASRQPLIVRAVRGDEEWLTNPGWVARQDVRAFAGVPMIAGDQVIGVLALFSRTTLTPADTDDLQFLAEFAATRLQSLGTPAPPAFLTRTQLRDLERRSIQAALAHANGKVFGPNGAAALLGIKPTTLASRITALALRTRQ